MKTFTYKNNLTGEILLKIESDDILSSDELFNQKFSGTFKKTVDKLPFIGVSIK